jgi:hypothetical protein
MDFEIVGEISDIETIAVGRGVRDRARLRKQYGRGRWRKLKGVAMVRLIDDTIRLAEVALVRGPRHWPERVQAETPFSRRAMKKVKDTGARFVVCLDNEGYRASLEVGKLYRMIPDEEAAAHGYVRVVDESGEDYAFAATRFHAVELPIAVEKALLSAAKV